MKRHPLALTLLGGLLLAGCASILTSCEDDDYWSYGPPDGWGSNYFYDRNLDGDWELSQVNFQPVERGDVNYLEFIGNGKGYYFYYSNGRLLQEDIAYFCQEKGPGSDSYKINIRYRDTGTASTMSYSLSNGNTSLLMSWRAQGETITYVYSKIPSVPW